MARKTAHADGQFEGYMLFNVTSIAADVQAHNTAYLLDPNGKIVHKWEGYEGHVPETASVHLHGMGGDIEAAIEALSRLKVDASKITDVEDIARVATLEDPDRHLLMLRQCYPRRI